jgi:hypothetical protein
MSLQDLAAVATAIGVALAAWQLYLAKQQAQLAFEDSLNAQYRSLLAELPLKAMLGRQLSDAELNACLGVFYRYFDLSNEQAFLFSLGRIRRSAWKNWLEGIGQNMERPAFQQAWQAILPDIDGSFDELKKLPGMGPTVGSLPLDATTLG